MALKKQFLFIVHGMGTHPADSWWVPWKKEIYEDLRFYEPFAGKSDEELERDYLGILPIGYDEVFVERFRERWGDLAGAIDDRHNLGKLAPVLEWIDGEDAADKAIFWEVLLDPLLWFTVRLARQATIAHVAKELAAGLEEIRAETGSLDAHILAHSLGTSVIHDTLISLSDSALTENAFAGLSYKWRSLTMVSNVSRLLQAWTTVSTTIALERYEAHSPSLQPGSSGKTLVRKYLNLRHRVDPFTWARPFNPGWTVSTYRDVELRRYDELTKVHDFETYFSHPLTHLLVFHNVFGDPRLGTMEEQDRAWNAYDQAYGRIAGDEFAHLRAMLNGDPERKMGFVELARFLLAIWKELR